MLVTLTLVVLMLVTFGVDALDINQGNFFSCSQLEKKIFPRAPAGLPREYSSLQLQQFLNGISHRTQVSAQSSNQGISSSPTACCRVNFPKIMRKPDVFFTRSYFHMKLFSRT